MAPQDLADPDKVPASLLESVLTYGEGLLKGTLKSQLPAEGQWATLGAVEKAAKK